MKYSDLIQNQSWNTEIFSHDHRSVGHHLNWRSTIKNENPMFTTYRRWSDVWVLYQIYRYQVPINIWLVLALTCLKTSRSSRIFPKPLKTTVCWVDIIIIGNIFCTSSGKSYHSNWHKTSSITSNRLDTLSPKSHVRKIDTNDQKIIVNGRINSIGLRRFCD